MCLIIYHPENTNMVSKNLLKRVWKRNDDGAGYSFWDTTAKTWHVRKGFMEWEDFWKSFNENNFSKSSVWIAHFRISTAGDTDQGNTHPFINCSNYDIMRKLEFSAKNIVFHNGMIGQGEKNISDTMLHIKHYIYPLFSKITKRTIKKIIQKLCDTSSNRWLLTKGRTLYLFGDWEEDDGVFYSNTTYKPAKSYPLYNSRDYHNAYGCSNSDWRKVWGLGKKEEEKKKKDDKISCPICGEKHFVMDSRYCIGESICYTCGAVFDSDTDEIFFFEPGAIIPKD